MIGLADGFVKLFAWKASGTVIGGVIVRHRASELIFPLALAVEHRPVSYTHLDVYKRQVHDPGSLQKTGCHASARRAGGARDATRADPRVETRDGSGVKVRPPSCLLYTS